MLPEKILGSGQPDRTFIPPQRKASLVQREVAKIGSSEPIFDGGIDLIMTIPQSACSADSPLYTRGPSCAPNRICGGGAPHASERKLDEPIGSAKGMPQGG